MPATYADRPESDWTHSHALAAGDELVDTNEGTPITVDEVREDGSVKCRVWIGERHGQGYHTEIWSEREANGALADGIFETLDGKSHELATY
jgi:uncharacterized protein YodC (DUF2158 family)